MKPEFKCVPMEELSPLIVGLIEEDIDVTITVTGNSMRPMLTHRKDTVVLTKCDPFTLKRGDLPLYKRDNGRYILHRIIRVHKDTYDMIGDHQYEVERGVPKKNVLCLVKAFTRKGKQYSCNEFKYKLYTFIWCLTIPFRRVLLWSYRLPSRLFKRNRKQK